MHTLFAILLSVISAATAFAQGQVNFNNYVPGANPPVNAPARLWYGEGAGSIAGLKVELWLLGAGGARNPIGPTTTFRESPPAAQYYINGITVVVPGVEIGQQATFVMRVFEGESYFMATFKGDYYGESGPVTVTLGGGTTVPADLIGLQPMLVHNWPEPSILALGLLGAGLFLLGRRRSTSNRIGLIEP